MNDHYTPFFPSYWYGATGQRIAEVGGPDALLLGAYLMANDRATSIGLYYLPFRSIALPLSEPRIVEAFDALDRAEFATYDAGTSFVWVREMARFRLGLRRRSDALDRRDSRVKLANKLYADVLDNPFLLRFHKRYVNALHLKAKRNTHLLVQKLGLSPNPPSTPRQRGVNASNRTVRTVLEQ